MRQSEIRQRFNDIIKASTSNKCISKMGTNISS